MKFTKRDLLLYAVTDRMWLDGASLADQVDEAVQAGVTLVQLREKDAPRDEFLALARELLTVTRRHNVPLIINDEVDIALACGADGVHVGQEDLEAGRVRELLGPDKILGVSAQTVAQAQHAERSGADYLGVGAVFATSTKPDASDVDFDTLRTICASVRIPVVAIGGIGADNALTLRGSGIAGLSVVSAIFAQPDIAAATRQLRALAEQVVSA